MFVFKPLTTVQPIQSEVGLSKQIPDFMQKQTQTNWCWITCGTSVGDYYWGEGTYTQCGIANTCLNKTTCCLDPKSCNETGLFSAALKAARSFVSRKLGSTTYDLVMAEIDLGRPLGANVAWTDGGGHSMTLTGYDTTGSMITIQDPGYGPSTMAFASFPSAYHGGGTWSDSYFTAKN